MQTHNNKKLQRNNCNGNEQPTHLNHEIDKPPLLALSTVALDLRPRTNCYQIWHAILLKYGSAAVPSHFGCVRDVILAISAVILLMGSALEMREIIMISLIGSSVNFARQIISLCVHGCFAYILLVLYFETLHFN